MNPQAVNEPGFDVFTENKRSVRMLTHAPSGQAVAFVAIGAMLVGSIGWSKREGEQVRKGEELGWFAYGGSTVVCVFPPGLITFDEDIRTTSLEGIESLVKVRARGADLNYPGRLI